VEQEQQVKEKEVKANVKANELKQMH